MNVKSFCDFYGHSQKQLSDLLGVSEGTVNRWASLGSKLPLSASASLMILAENEDLRRRVIASESLYDAIVTFFEAHEPVRRN